MATPVRDGVTSTDEITMVRCRVGRLGYDPPSGDKSLRMTRPPPPYPRDMIGYGRHPPDPRWPNGARVAVQFVVNYEEGGENNILHGDAASEAFLSDVLGAVPWPGQRHMNVESMYEYGARGLSASASNARWRMSLASPMCAT